MSKYYLIKTEYPITTYKDDEVVDDITPDMIGKNFVELYDYELHRIKDEFMNDICKNGEEEIAQDIIDKIKKVLNNENDNSQA